MRAAEAKEDQGMITSVRWSAVSADLPGTGATMRHVVIPAGTMAKRHDHAHEQFLFVASGSGVLECEGGPITLAPGVALHLPAGSWHGATFIADTVLIEFNLA